MSRSAWKVFPHYANLYFYSTIIQREILYFFTPLHLFDTHSSCYFASFTLINILETVFQTILLCDSLTIKHNVLEVLCHILDAYKMLAVPSKGHTYYKTSDKINTYLCSRTFFLSLDSHSSFHHPSALPVAIWSGTSPYIIDHCIYLFIQISHP